ncbi:MAG: hypothetical protein CVU89_07630 [Firmicutes bacterium HGW-Firmicutes-14]|nr:MAG: hypothetical protein CVU89_07630 [Firmicutes bacterium HGW-Firmicutes-14]
MTGFPRRPAVILILILFLAAGFSGCSFSIGGSPQKKQEIDPLEIRRNVKQEMKSPETRKLILDAARTQKLEELLKTPEADMLIQEEVSKNLSTSEINVKLQEIMKEVMAMPAVQKQLQQDITKSFQDPDVKKALSEAVQKALTEIIQGGGGQGAGGGAGGQAGDQTQGGSGSM